MWTPNMPDPVVKMLCHKGPVNALDVDISGHYMYTSALDGQLKVWDVRKYQMIHEYFTPRPATTIAVSQRGVVGVGYAGTVQV
jgi:U3 small nucleolar RNA-associated protein 7